MLAEPNSKTKEELLEHYSRRSNANTIEDAQYAVAIMVKCTSDLQGSADEISKSVDKFRVSIEDIGKSSDKLSHKLFWLNVILAFATAVGAIATLILSLRR